MQGRVEYKEGKDDELKRKWRCYKYFKPYTALSRTIYLKENIHFSLFLFNI